MSRNIDPTNITSTHYKHCRMYDNNGQNRLDAID